jgi:hypothetical protein
LISTSQGALRNPSVTYRDNWSVIFEKKKEAITNPAGGAAPRGVSGPPGAGQQPTHYPPVRIATGRDPLHRLLGEGLGLLFSLSLVPWK